MRGRGVSGARETWRRLPWLLGLAVSPLLFGCVTADGQATLGLLFGFSLLLHARASVAPREVAVLPRGGGWVLLAVLLLPLLPMPAVLVRMVDPTRFGLAESFPAAEGGAPAWIPLTLSSAATWQRIWELAITVSAFVLGRQCGRARRGGAELVAAVAGGLFCLAWSDVWLRGSVHDSLLGLWRPSSMGAAAGTFANRNHFADWLYVGSLFIFGWLVRRQWPLQSARTEPLPPEKGAWWRSAGLLALIVFALTMGVMCGSRGGMLGLMAGVLAWTLMLSRRSVNRGRALALGALGLGLFVVVVLGSEFLLRRFVLGDEQAKASPDFKLAIWKGALRMFPRFAVFGTGWGTFPITFDIFKTFGESNTFLHAENGYVELLLESGLLGLAIFGGAAVAVIRRWGRVFLREKVQEPELFFGALAAVAAFAVHSICEFVFEIPATAVLGASVAGFALGCCDRRGGSVALRSPRVGVVLLRGALAAGVMGVAVVQGAAYLKWREAERAGNVYAALPPMEKSLRLWPWDSARQLGRVKASAAAMPQKAVAAELVGIKELLGQAISRDPYNWQLRVERARLDAVWGDARTARSEVLQAMKLNPRQQRIPLEFARYFARRDRAVALELLRSIPPEENRRLAETMSIAWGIEEDTGVLWSLCPSTPQGFKTLSDVALGLRLYPLAAQAALRLQEKGEVDRESLAARLLDSQRPDLVLALIPTNAPGARWHLLRARAEWARKNYAGAVAEAESVWMESRLAGTEIFRRSAGEDAVEKSAGVLNVEEAAARAESLFRRPAAGRDLGQLQLLSGRFPESLRIRWMVFRTELERNQSEAAAGTAVEMARRVAEREGR